MPPISFARGAPAPECIDAELFAECTAAALERDGTTILSYGPGGGYGPLRERLAERHGATPARVVITTGGLQGFSFYAAELLARRPGRVLVEGPTYDRPLKLLVRAEPKWPSCRWTTRGSTRRASSGARPRRQRVVPLHDPDLPEPERPHAVDPAPAGLAELVDARGLAVLEDDPYGLVRYEGEPPPSLHALEGGPSSRTRRRSRRRSRPERASAGLSCRRSSPPLEERAVSTYISPPYLGQAAVDDSSPAAPSSRTSSGSSGLRARRDAMLSALEAGSAATPRGAGPRAATSSGSTFRTGSTRPSFSNERRRRASRSSAGRTFSRAARAADRRPGSRSATSRPAGSRRASRSSRTFSAGRAARGARRGRDRSRR